MPVLVPERRHARCPEQPIAQQIALSVRGKDYEFAKQTGLKLAQFKNEL